MLTEDQELTRCSINESGRYTAAKSLPHVVLLCEAAGGVMRHILDLYRGLKERNFEVTLVLSPFRVDDRYREELANTSPGDLIWVPTMRGPHWTDLRALLAIRKILLKTPRPVVLHAHSTKAGLLGSLIVRHAQGSIYTPHAFRGMDPSLSGLKKKFISWIEERYSGLYKVIVTEVPLELHYAERIGIPRDKLHMIPNGIDASRIDFPAIKQQRSKSIHNPILGFVGRLVYQKNPHLFIHTMHEVRKRGIDATAIVLGDGPLKPELMALANEYGLADKIDWRSEVPAAAFYPQMDVMVHTSLYEALPYTLIEACGALLPIAALANPGSEAVLGEVLPENITHTPDAASLADIAIRLLTQDTYRYETLTQLQTIALRFSTNAMFENYAKLYTSLV